MYYTNANLIKRIKDINEKLIDEKDGAGVLVGGIGISKGQKKRGGIRAGKMGGVQAGMMGGLRAGKMPFSHFFKEYMLDHEGMNPRIAMKKAAEIYDSMGGYGTREGALRGWATRRRKMKEKNCGDCNCEKYGGYGTREGALRGWAKRRRCKKCCSGGKVNLNKILQNLKKGYRKGERIYKKGKKIYDILEKDEGIRDFRKLLSGKGGRGTREEWREYLKKCGKDFEELHRKRGKRKPSAWNNLVSQVRLENPDLSFKQAVELAKNIYHSGSQAIVPYYESESQEIVPYIEEEEEEYYPPPNIRMQVKRNVRKARKPSLENFIKKYMKEFREESGMARLPRELSIQIRQIAIDEYDDLYG